MLFRVEPDFEPLFLSMALYDAKERRKISENFYLDLNSDLMKRMLQNHVPYADMSTLARSCIFNVSAHSAQDIFLVIRVGKCHAKKDLHKLPISSLRFRNEYYLELSAEN